MDISPEYINIPVDVWTLIDIKINSMRINRISHAPSAYYYLYLKAGSPPPLDGDISEATLAFTGGRTNLIIEVSELVDVYMLTKRVAGRVSFENAISTDVLLQDQTTPAFDFYFLQEKSITFLVADVAINDRQLIVDNAGGVIIGDCIGVFSGLSGEARYFYGTVIGIAGTTITIDTPFDFAFEAGDPVVFSLRDLNVDGSVVPQIFSVFAGGPDTELVIDITRIIITMETNQPPDFNRFGDIIGGLDNGLVLRRFDGVARNLWNFDNNREIANFSYDYTPYLASNPGIGINGLAARYSFAGQDKHGVAVRLTNADALELIVQDDLSSLVNFRVIAQGHQVK